MMNLKRWFASPDTTLTYDFNTPMLSNIVDEMERPVPIPPPQMLYDLGSYRTPYSVLFKRPRNVLQG